MRGWGGGVVTEGESGQHGKATGDHLLSSSVEDSRIGGMTSRTDRPTTRTPSKVF